MDVGARGNNRLYELFRAADDGDLRRRTDVLFGKNPVQIIDVCDGLRTGATPMSLRVMWPSSRRKD